MIRRGVPEDAARIAEIHVFGWRCAYRGIVSDEMLYNRMRVATAIERWKQSLESGGEETWVVEAEGIVQGFMTMGDSRDPDKDASSFELWGIYVDPGFLRRGRGAELVAHCLAEAERRGKKEVLLWVFEKNPIGRSFYEKQGFRPEGLSQVIEKFGAVELRYVKTLGPGAWAAGRS